MAFVQTGDGGLDYFPCHYGRSRLTYRGPRRDLSGPYLTALGGTETFGRFVPTPFAALIEERLGIPVANLGCLNAGPDVYLCDSGAAEVAGLARVAVLQVMEAQNLTNRFYTVHPRRNDRFVAATPLLRSMYREVDFTEIHFTRHLIHALRARGGERFRPVEEELRRVWVDRMTAILTRLPKRRILFWTADHPPPIRGEGLVTEEPMFVDRGMIAALIPHVAEYVEHVTSPAALAEGVGRMRARPAEAIAASGLPGEAAHREAADLLVPVIRRLL
jgi:hypothetical protein